MGGHQTETPIEEERDRDRVTDRWTIGWINTRLRVCYTDIRQTDVWIYEHQTDRQTDRQTGRHREDINLYISIDFLNYYDIIPKK